MLSSPINAKCGLQESLKERLKWISDTIEVR